MDITDFALVASK